MIAIVVAVVVFVEQVIVINARIPSPSMENTIMTGDQIFGNRLAYVKSDPQRYDIVIFYYPDDEKQKFIKRVIGLPGETVQIMDDGSIYINGEKLEENYGMEVIKPETIGRAAEPIELGDDEYFVMGDNRNNSSDSRTDMVGNITRENIIGKAWLRIWPVSDFGVLQHQ